MTIKEACEIASVDMDELQKEATKYFKAKMARKEYHKYKHNTLAQKRLFIDCLNETLMSKASINNKLKELLEAKND